MIMHVSCFCLLADAFTPLTTTPGIHTHTPAHTQEAALLDGIRAGVVGGLKCQRCGPAHLAIASVSSSSSSSDAAVAAASILPEWSRRLKGEGKAATTEEPHPCDALEGALAALRADPLKRGQTVVTMGSASGVMDATGHLVRAVLAAHGEGVLTGRVGAAMALLRTLLVLDDAALLSSPMAVRFALDGDGLVGAAFDMFLIERDPAKYDSLRCVRTTVSLSFCGGGV